MGISKNTRSGTLEGILVPNTNIKPKSVEVSTQALKFSFTLITPESNSNIICFCFLTQFNRILIDLCCSAFPFCRNYENSKRANITNIWIR
jgi:hypothetical protein